MIFTFLFCFVSCYVGIHACFTRICWQYQLFWIVSLFLTDKKVGRVRFTIQRNCIKICVKNEIKCAKTFEMLTVADLRKADKMSMTTLVLAEHVNNR